LRYLSTVKIPRPFNQMSLGRRDLLFYVLQEAMFLVNRRGFVINIFAEFLLFFLVFPYVHSSVGLTGFL